MTEIIKQWIQEKLGIIVRLTPDTFSELTKDGYLLCRILRNYEIINEDQLKMVEKSSVRSVCLKNFEQHIINWLKIINISLSPDEIIDIISCNGLASLSLFYRVFLELHEKDCLTFITKNRLSEKFRPKLSKFTVQHVNEDPIGQVVNSKYKGYLDNSNAVIHWLQDRLEMVMTKCRNAREEYLNMMRTTERRISNNMTMPTSLPVYDKHNYDQIANTSEISLNMTYEELIKEKREMRKLRGFQPDIEESRQILGKIKDKFKSKAENDVFMRELQKQIMKNYWSQVIVEENLDFNKGVADKMLKQSVYEKQMEKKLREIKYQKENILESKRIICESITKELEAEFVEKLMDRNDQLNKNDFQYYLEKERALQLHKSIYKEKLRLKAEKTFKLCQDTIKAICNMAIKLSEFKHYFGEEPTERIVDNWRKMVSSGHDFEEPEVRVEDIVVRRDSIHIEPIIQNEIEKQNEIDAKDFESYESFEWPWILKHFPYEQVKEMQNGMNILGHLVHLLLDLKYPLPALPSPPNLPNVDIRVCINGLPDLSYLQLLQKMLNHKNILVIELQDAVNHSINAYKNEAKDELEDDEEDNNLFNEKNQQLKKGEKSKAAPKPELYEEDELEIKHSDKCLQTPKLYPGEKLKLSPIAELGRLACDQLSLGNYLTDFLMVSMFIEYVKTKQDHIKGWVLVNYPTTFEQAVLFEEALSGLQVPGISDDHKLFKSLTDIVNICEPMRREEEDGRRFSRLLSDIAQKHEPPPYDTILTAFINVCPVAEPIDENEIPKEIEEIEDSSKLQDFYTDQGCNYTALYENFDYYTMKHIAKLIIGDYSIPPKSSVELFGDTIRYLDAEKGDDTKSLSSFKHGEKKQPERIQKVVKPKDLSKGESHKSIDAPEGKKDKKSATILIHNEKWTQIPELKIVEVEEEEEAPKAGEEGWDYANLLIPRDIGLVLADIWENMEEIYINDLSQVFFQKRILLNALMPYVDYARKFVRKYITIGDQRQLYILKFQEIFNTFDDDFRADKEFKAVLHYLISELKDKLLVISDIKMSRAERQRQEMIKQNWAPQQIIELTNVYISGFQIELDRYCDTITFINDYFAGLITQMPIDDVLQKEILQKTPLENLEIEKEVNGILLNVENLAINPMISKLENQYRKGLALVDKYEAFAFASCDKVNSLFLTSNGNGKGKGKSGKQKVSKGNCLTVFEPSDKIKQNAHYIFDAWHCTLKGELARIKIRMKLLKRDGIENLEVFLNTVKNAYHSLYEENRLKYETDTNNINKACYYLAIAIEKEVSIQEELLLTEDQFLIHPEKILYPDLKQKEPDLSDGITFSIPQLANMTEIFFDLAPSGWLPERTFTFLFQDIILNNDKDMVPKEWTKLNGPNINFIAKELFGIQEFIYWKDFIIYNLVLPYPTVQQIVETRKKFIEIDSKFTEVIGLEQFKNIHCWFEVDENADYDSVKKLLLRLYKVNDNSFNYTAMLLDFCKSDTNLGGLAKALAVVSGKIICWDPEIGEMFVAQTLEQRRLHEEEVKARDKERKENMELVTTIVDELIDQTVHACDSLIITEILNEDKVDKPYEENLLTEAQLVTEEESTNKELNEEQTQAEEDTDLKNEKSDSTLNESITLQEEHVFSNVAVGFEVKRFPSFDYFLQFDDLITVLSRSLNTKNDKTIENVIFFGNLRSIFETCVNPNFNNKVLSHEFLNKSKFLKLLDKIKKFLIKRPHQMVEKFLVELQLNEWCD